MHPDNRVELFRIDGPHPRHKFCVNAVIEIVHHFEILDQTQIIENQAQVKATVLKTTSAKSLTTYCFCQAKQPFVNFRARSRRFFIGQIAHTRDPVR